MASKVLTHPFLIHEEEATVIENKGFSRDWSKTSSTLRVPAISCPTMPKFVTVPLFAVVAGSSTCLKNRLLLVSVQQSWVGRTKGIGFSGIPSKDLPYGFLTQGGSHLTSDFIVQLKISLF